MWPWSLSCLLSVLLMLSACASQERRPQVAIPRSAPENLLLPCPDLAPPPGPQMSELLTTYVKTAGAYRQCQNRHGSLAKWVKEDKR